MAERLTERQRLQRAHALVVHRAAGCPPAAAWRKANTGSKASEKSAAEMCRREVHWLERWMAEHPDVPVPAGDWRGPSAKRCIGVADRPCGQEISRRRKRCEACAAEQRRLQQRGYRRNYYKANREPCNAKRNERRGRQQARELVEAAEAAKRAEEERRAAMPRMIVDKRTGKTCLYDPKTGRREYPDSQGRFPVPSIRGRTT